MEDWRIIEDFPDYECSNFGKFRRRTPGRGATEGKLRKSYQNSVTGYMSVTLANCVRPELARTQAAHKIVAKTWIPNPDNHPHVGFKDKDRSNIEVSNLFWHPAFATSYVYCIDLENVNTGEKYECLPMSTATLICNVSSHLLKRAVDAGIVQIMGDWKVSGNKLR
jgi:hypothetical protein